MKEELVEFETAKLAKEKGFNWQVNRYYYNNQIDPTRLGHGTTSNYNDTRLKQSAPTQSLLQRWLREKHKKFITVTAKGFVKGSGRETIRWTNNISQRKNKYFTTYEQALEAGLQEALKLI